MRVRKITKSSETDFGWLSGNCCRDTVRLRTHSAETLGSWIIRKNAGFLPRDAAKSVVYAVHIWSFWDFGTVRALMFPSWLLHVFLCLVCFVSPWLFADNNCSCLCVLVLYIMVSYHIIVCFMMLYYVIWSYVMLYHLFLHYMVVFVLCMWYYTLFVILSSTMSCCMICCYNMLFYNSSYHVCIFLMHHVIPKYAMLYGIILHHSSSFFIGLTHSLSYL